MTKKPKHEVECRCATCEAMAGGMSKEEAFRQRHEWEQKCLEKYGWFAHYVGQDEETPYNFNAHTHGLSERYNHLDLQVVFPLQEEVCHSILATVAERIKAGEVFKHGDKVKKVIGNGLEVLMHEAWEQDRPVLRIILPDKYGNLDYDAITGVFRNQYTDLQNLTPPRKGGEVS